MRLATPLDELTEKEWAAQVYELARTLGWKRYHTYRSKNSAAGFPDEVLVRERVIFAELKREKGKLSDAQRGWFHDLHNAGAEVYVWKPSDLEEVAGILASRGRIAA